MGRPWDVGDRGCGLRQEAHLYEYWISGTHLGDLTFRKKSEHLIDVLFQNLSVHGASLTPQISVAQYKASS